MKPIYKFFILVAVVAILVVIFLRLGERELKLGNTEGRIPTYDEAVPDGFSSLNAPRVLDPRDAGELIGPRLAISGISNTIADSACPNRMPDCIAAAQYKWVQRNIEFTDDLPTREYIISPEETILYREGDELTTNVLLASLLRAQGFETRIGHAPYSSFTEAIVMNETIRLDPGCSSCRYGNARYNGVEARITWIS